MTSRFFLLAAAPLVVSLAFAKAAPPPAVYDPDPSQPGAGKLQAETWSKETPTVSLWLTRIDDETRGAYIRKHTGLTIDPFTSAPGVEKGGFFTFHVLIENRTEARVVFQPMACRLQTTWKDVQSPLDLPTIMAVFAMMGRPAPDGIEKLPAAVIDGEVVLQAGERRDGLVVFRAVDPTSKHFQVDIGATLGSGDPLALSAFYAKRKTK